MEVMKFIGEFAPYLIPFFGAIFLIVFTKKYLFSGMISAEMHRERARPGEGPGPDSGRGVAALD